MNIIKSNLPLVSVGIPTYNRSEGLKRTLNCILKQDYPNIQIIVSDNASPQTETESVVRNAMALDNRVIFFRQDANIGAWKNFLFVLQAAAGDYFMWAADDDEWEPDFISRCVSNIEGLGSVMCDFETINRAKNSVGKNQMPALGPTISAFKNADHFFKNMQPSLIYGLHRRSDVQFVLNESLFDFYDCYFALRMILGPGIKTIEGVSYRAGIDTDEYCIKPTDNVSGKLRYSPFLCKVLSLYFQCKKLNLKEKLILSISFLRLMIKLIVHHERTHKTLFYFFFLILDSTLKIFEKPKMLIQRIRVGTKK